MDSFTAAGMGLECAFHCTIFNYLSLIIKEIALNNQVKPGPFMIREGKAKEFWSDCQHYGGFNDKQRKNNLG